ncbi:LexA family transcriptional regulator [Virgibacillus phage Mimir87]|nr:LexA family transcriptional regulator [Virgibacillus phage Mimir87]
MNRGKYLDSIIKEKGYNLMSFSRKSGVAYTTLRSMIERDLKNASIDNVIKVCKALGISTDDLANYTNRSMIAEPAVPYNVDKSIQIPLYGDVAAGELARIDGVTLNDLDQVNLPKEVLGKHQSNKDLFALKVNGDSMNKLIPNGSHVIAKPMDTTELKDGDIVIYSFDGDYSMKRFRRDDEDQVLIFSPESTITKFRDVVIPFDTQNELKIHGKVVLYSVTLD